MEVDIEGLEEFQNTVKGLINSAKEFKNLKEKVANQREALANKEAAIQDYRKSLSFDEDVMGLHDKQVQKLVDKNKELADELEKFNKANEGLFDQGKEYVLENAKLRDRIRQLKASNQQYAGKLVALGHVLHRKPSNVGVELR